MRKKIKNKKQRVLALVLSLWFLVGVYPEGQMWTSSKPVNDHCFAHLGINEVDTFKAHFKTDLLAHRTKYLNAKCWLEAYGNYEGGTISNRKGGRNRAEMVFNCEFWD
jgi:hypothetical protein